MDTSLTYRESRNELTRILSEEEKDIKADTYIKEWELTRHTLMTREDLSLVMQASSLETYNTKNQNIMKQIKACFLDQITQNETKKEKPKKKKAEKKEKNKEIKVETIQQTITDHPILNTRKALESERNNASMSGSNTGEKRKEVYEKAKKLITETLPKSAQQRLNKHLTSQSTFAVGIQSHKFFQKVEKELQEHLQKTHKDL